MSKIIPFRPKFKTPSDNLDELIKHCRDVIKIYKDQGGFNVDEWKTTHGRAMAMRFSVYDGGKTGKKFTPLPSPYSLFAKSYVRHKQNLKEVTSIANEMVVVQVVYDALIAVHGVADILKIDGLVQKKIVEILEKRYPKSSKLSKYGGALQTFYKFLRDKGIAPALPQWKKPGKWKRAKSKAQGTDPESLKWQEEHCPTMHEMLALADCFHLAKTPEDKYWSSVCTLLMFSPGRGSEPFVLTVNCIGEDNGSHYVSWYGRKGFGFSKKWIPKVLVPAVKEAVKRLTEISQPAREAAKFAHDKPGKFLRHTDCITPDGASEGKTLSFEEFCAATNIQATAQKHKDKGHSEKYAWNQTAAKTKWIKTLLEGGPITYQRLAEYTVKKYKGKAWPNIPDTDRPIWESLLLIRENEFHNEFETKQFSWTLPDVDRLNDQLGRRFADTIFERLGLKDEDGSEIFMTSHQPRVWLSTNAERGGMDAWQLAQWASRTRVKDNVNYDLRTKKEKLAQAKEILRLTKAPEALEAIKLNLPVTYESLGVNRIGIADPTLWGMCVHDFAMSPCQKDGDCTICKEHYCIKGMPKTLDRLKDLGAKVAVSLGRSIKAAGSGVFGSDRWATYYGWKLAHINTQIKRIEDPDTPEGAVLWIPPEHDPSPVKRALEAQGHDTNTGTESPDVKQLVDIKKLMGF